jgi:signal transduction histidine kinase
MNSLKLRRWSPFMEAGKAADIAAIQAISCVPTILEAVAASTGLRFVCVARVTADAWTSCAVLDKVDFGMNVGDDLDVATTLCEEVRDTGLPVVIDHVSEDAHYCDHRTPRIYGFQSYISIPIFRPDGSYFGTLCGLDPLPCKLKVPAVMSTLTLFAQLISLQLENERKLSESQAALLTERGTAELREQFVAVLGHDLRTPLASVLNGAQLLQRRSLDQTAATVVERIRRSALRMAALVDDVLDLTRGRMGGGITLKLRDERSLADILQQVVAELRSTHPGRELHSEIDIAVPVRCDPARLGQLLSNLLKNALVHGCMERPVRVAAHADDHGLVLAVSNGGPAIPADTLSKLFQPYWRGKRRDVGEGLGLGLFIVAEIARAHGGALDVSSTDESTTFTFTLART